MTFGIIRVYFRFAQINPNIYAARISLAVCMLILNNMAADIGSYPFANQCSPYRSGSIFSFTFFVSLLLSLFLSLSLFSLFLFFSLSNSRSHPRKYAIFRDISSRNCKLCIVCVKLASVQNQKQPAKSQIICYRCRINVNLALGNIL